MLALNSAVDDGRFQLLDLIGKGASSVAYLGYDTRSTSAKPKYYAVKCLSRLKTDGHSLMREIRLHKLVSTHQGIVTLRRCIAEGPFQLLIMDYCPDGDLFKQITQRRMWLLLLYISASSNAAANRSVFRQRRPHS